MKLPPCCQIQAVSCSKIPLWERTRPRRQCVRRRIYFGFTVLSTALILVMQYIQHARLQDNKSWPEHLHTQVAQEAVHQSASINSLRGEPDLGTPARGGLPGTIARRTEDGWRISGRKIYSTGSHGLTWFNVWGAAMTKIRWSAVGWCTRTALAFASSRIGTIWACARRAAMK